MNLPVYKMLGFRHKDTLYWVAIPINKFRKWNFGKVNLKELANV